ncbi:TetR/AcrR family transcriptional regulator [Dactylosporangium sp. NPDC051541]|uniref:TetR/AcrR family transcriptional regulator n=1 Tax=Dactylosporangium sp. NPDC051541 TaxID=3363977 RepID=UPI0037940949
MTSSTTAGRPSEARDRLLGTASRIFYAEGIRSVGIDRLVAEAQVTRATLYRHFPGKDDLILAYLTAADQAIRAGVEEVVAAGLPGPETIRAISQGIAGNIRSEGFRGCAFLNAAAEYPEPDHPIHLAVLAHRQWFLDTVTAVLGDPAAGRHYVMLRDGAMAAGCLFDPALIDATFLAAVEGLLCS